MTVSFLSVFIALIAYSMLDLSKAFQKISLERMRKSRSVGLAIWIGATSSTTVSSFLLLYAVSIGSILIVGAMAGTGLAALTLFSAFVLKEHVGWREMLGVVTILIGPVLMASVAGIQSETLLIARCFYYIGAITLGYFISLAVLYRKPRFFGLAIGGFSGALGGMVLLFQKISTTAHGRSVTWITVLESEVPFEWMASALAVIVNPYALTWVILSILSTVVLQFAYKHNDAIRIVPVFAANSILVPIVGGLLCFGEVLRTIQWIGVASILTGVALITIHPARKPTSRQDH